MSAGSLSTLRKRNRVNPMAGMTAAEKNAYLTNKTLAFRGPTYNFSAEKPEPFVGVPVASSRFSTS